MSMYGPRRVVLAAKLSRSGKKLVSISGGKAHIPLGWWYETDGAYYADLKGTVLGGFPTKKALREAVAATERGWLRPPRDMRR